MHHNSTLIQMLWSAGIASRQNLFRFDGRIFQLTIGISMETNCAPLLADLCLHSFGAEFIQGLMKAVKNMYCLSFHCHIEIHK